MLTSVVIRSCNEAPRLALTLASLERQNSLNEVVVVDDGSSDDTQERLCSAAQRLPLTVVRNAAPQGRSAASNAGAAAASGDLLIFLDGDMPVAPGFVGAHVAAHVDANVPRIARGEHRHLRATRLLEDPERGLPFPSQAERHARLSLSEKASLRVTREQVLDDFAAIARRSQPGLYPGAGPARLQEVEIQALTDSPDCPLLWAAAGGSNQSVPRQSFLDAGGFDPELDINEHREAALRLTRTGLRMTFAAGARTYHLTHRAGWRDPLAFEGWERRFWSRHPRPEVALLSVFWASLTGHPSIAPDRRILSLPALAEAATAAAAAGAPTVTAGGCRAALGFAERLA